MFGLVYRIPSFWIIFKGEELARSALSLVNSLLPSTISRNHDHSKLQKILGLRGSSYSLSTRFIDIAIHRFFRAFWNFQFARLKVRQNMVHNETTNRPRLGESICKTSLNESTSPVCSRSDCLVGS